MSAVASRLWLDLCTSVSFLGTGVSVAHLGTLVAMGVCLVVAVRWWQSIPRGMWAVCAGWLVILLIGVVRAEAPGAVVVGLRYASGVLIGMAVAATWTQVHRRIWPMAMLGAALFPVGLSLLMLPGEHWVELHDVWRFMGPYSVLHALAMAMGVTAAIGMGVAADPQRPGMARGVGLFVGLCALIPLAASATRSGVVWVGTAVLVTAAVQRRWRLLGVLAVGVVLGVAAVPGLRVRTVELVFALGGQAPEQGWEWLGTGRVAIWTRSWAAFSELPLVDRVLGTGLAGYETFWKAKEPHSEYLSLLYQFGPMGPLVFLATGVSAIVATARRQPAQRALFIGLVVATLVTSLVGSTLLVRLVVSWVFWVAVGVLISRPEEATATTA
ncbi:MAG: hypothetical protein ACJATT_001609 [Myxococcota bacterium]